MMAKKKVTSTGSADSSVLRRSSRETSRKQSTSSAVNSRKSERIEKQTSPSPSPVENELEKIEKQMGSNPLRRSDRVKKLVEIPNIKSTKENNTKQCSEDVNEDPDVCSRKRKRLSAIHYKASYKPQLQRIVSDDVEGPKVEDKSLQANTGENEDVDKEQKGQNSIRVQIASNGDGKAERVIDLDQIEVGDCPQTKSIDDKSIESGDVDSQIDGSKSNRDIENSDNQMFHTSSYRIEHDLQNQQELDTCQEEDVSRKSKESFEKINREWDEKRASLKHDYVLEKCFIYALYRNPSIRSEKLQILEKAFVNELKKHERLLEIRLQDLKTTMLAAKAQVAADSDISLHGSHSRTPEVVPTLPENPIEVQSHDEFGCNASEKEMVDATVSSELIGEVTAQQVDDDDMEVDVAEKVDSSQENAKGDTSSPDASHAVERHNETDIAPHVISVETPAGNYNNKNDEDGNVGLEATVSSELIGEITGKQPDDDMDVDVAEKLDSSNEKAKGGTSSPVMAHAVEDHNETGVIVISPHIDSGEMETPAGNYHKENDEDGAVVLDTTVSSEQITAVPAQQLDDDMEVDVSQKSDSCHGNAKGGTSSPDATHTPEDRNRTGVIDTAPHVDSGDMEMPAGNYNKEDDEDGTVVLDTLLVVEDRCETVDDVAPEVEFAEMETPAGACNKENAEDHSGANQLVKIIPDNSSVDPTVSESQPDTLLPTACEETTLTMQQSGQCLEENVDAVADMRHEATSIAPAPPVNELDRFDNLVNRVSSQMPNQTNPLQAEVERLHTIKENVTKFHQESKQKLNSECEKEIAEIIAQIRLKYEAKHEEADAAYNSKRVELETNISKVILNRILSESFRSKCQELNPSDQPPVSQARLMQQLRMLCVPPEQYSVHQPPILQPQSRLPVQIVHQPEALFSSTPSRLTPFNTNIKPLSTTHTRPPYVSFPSTTPTRPPPGFNQIISSPFRPTFY